MKDNEFEYVTEEQRTALKFAILAGEPEMCDEELDGKLVRLLAWVDQLARNSEAVEAAVTGRNIVTFDADQAEPSLRPAPWATE